MPCNGTTTTCEALWMGVPVLSLIGQRHSARVSASLLQQVGLEDRITISPDQFVERGRQKAAEISGLVKLRHSLRGQFDATLGDAPAHTRRLEAAFSQILQPAAHN